MRRHLLGIIAAALLAGYIGLLLWGPRDGTTRTIASVCMRAGLVLAALWLALPQVTALLARVPPWMIACLLVGGLAIIARPRLIVVIGPLLAAAGIVQFIGWLFTPLPPKGSGKQRRQPPPNE